MRGATSHYFAPGEEELAFSLEFTRRSLGEGGAL